MIKILIALLSFSMVIIAQDISRSRLETIVDLIVSNSPKISKYVNEEELEISKRFGINYEGVDNKFFIANDFPLNISEKIQNKQIQLDYKLNKLEDDFSLLRIDIPSINFNKEYYLKDSSIISSIYYCTKNWKMIDSEYFKFIVSDDSLINEYSIKRLEKFITKMFDVLKFTEQQKETIKQQKIYYFLCKDEDEIKKVTGFATRGIFILAQDYVVTIYNTHYHELAHLLINFKLKKVPLFVHPFLQEGFAVDFGGRGGLDAHTIFETGVFLEKSRFADYKELLSKTNFDNTNASISYPIAGLYINFLVKQIGIDNFIKLYKKYSASTSSKLIDVINSKNLPNEEKWIDYLNSLADNNPININDNLDLNAFSVITKQNNFEVYQRDKKYLFRVKNNLLIKSNENFPNYKSKIFSEYFPDKKYNSEKYLIIANQNEISIYNLFDNNLIGKYVASFSIPRGEVVNRNGFYEFLVDKDIFDEELSSGNF